MKQNYKVSGLNQLINEKSELRIWADYIITVTDDYAPFTNFQVHCLDRTDDDGPNIADMDCVLEFIENIPTNSNIVIHCSAGISRSPAFLLYVLMCYEGLNYKEAYQIMRNIKPIAHPNKKVIKIIDEKFNLGNKLISLCNY